MIFKTGTKVLTNVSLSASGRACWVGVGHRRDRLSLVPSSFSLARERAGVMGPSPGLWAAPVGMLVLTWECASHAVAMS